MNAIPRTGISTAMPLLMHFTPRTKVVECEEEKFLYDETTQSVIYSMAGKKGTNSRKQIATKKGTGVQTDYANKKDD